MARALHGISRALNRFRINSAGTRQESDSDDGDDEDSDEGRGSPLNAAMMSRRSGEKRKISTADAESGGDRYASSSSSSSVSETRTATPLPSGSGPSYVTCKRRKSPVSLTPSLCCNTATRDSTAGCKTHTYVFRIKSKTSPEPDMTDLTPRHSTCSNVSNKSDNDHVDRKGHKKRSSGVSLESEVRVACEMGDVWTEAYYETPCDRRRDVRTGHEFTDRILRNIEFHGYNLQCKIGSGKYGSVMMAVCRHSEFDRYVAVKFILKTELGHLIKSSGHKHGGGAWHMDMPDEVVQLKQVHHPNIVRFYEYLNISGRQCIVMEYCENGSIEDLLRRKPCGFFTEPIARKYFHGMFSAVEYLHHQCIVHRDIKCANFVTDKRDVVKLCDFGSARSFRVGDALMEDFPGSSGYFPPELVRKLSYNPRLADIWSLGVSLYVMLTGRLPLTTDTKELLKIFETARTLPFPQNKILILSANARALVTGMCMFSPDLRWSLARIKVSDWFIFQDNKVAIGNYYLARQPQKIKCGDKELEQKSFFEL